MGCCASINKPSSTSHMKQNSPPPHPLLEEETVKEVLTETPNVTIKPNIQEKQQNNNFYKQPTTEEVSDICSTHSESVSTLSTEKTNNGDDDDTEVRQRSPENLRNRSVSGELRRRKIVGKSPGTSEASPGRIRFVPGREKDGSVPDGPRGKSGSGSIRMSMSTLTRADGVGTRSGQSPGRDGSELAGKNREMEEGNRENKWPMTSNESLENPLVSLECFIFL